jgi:hypothetical protein
LILTRFGGFFFVSKKVIPVTKHCVAWRTEHEFKFYTAYRNQLYGAALSIEHTETSYMEQRGAPRKSIQCIEIMQCSVDSKKSEQNPLCKLLI